MTRHDTQEVEALMQDTGPAAQFVKHDQGKNRLDLLPTEALEEIGMVLTHGAEKYAAENWRRGAAWSRYYGATLRHLFAWKEGQDEDLDSGLNHLAHASCCLLFLLTSQQLGLGTDDRWTRQPGGKT